MSDSHDLPRRARVVSPPLNSNGDRMVRVSRPCPHASPDHKPHDQMGFTIARAVQPGTALSDDAVVLADTADEQDVETIGELKRRGGRGPARVVSAEYRSNYDTIFGKRPATGVA